MNRPHIRHRFQNIRDRSEFLGLSADAAERDGADSVFALSAERLRLMGTVSVACMLPLCDSNAFVAGFGASEFIGRCSIPVFFGACAMTQDKSASQIAATVAELGFAGAMRLGVQHWRFKTTAVAKRKRDAQDRALLAFGRSLGLVGASQRVLELYRPRPPAMQKMVVNG